MINNKLTLEEISEQIECTIQRGEEINEEVDALIEKDKSKTNAEELLDHLKKLLDLQEELEANKICVKSLLAKILEQAIVEGIIDGLEESGT